MNFDLLTIGLICATAVLYTIFLPGRWRQTGLLATAVVAIYWLQPFSPLRFADFLLQTITILLTVLVWFTIRPANQPLRPSDRNSLLFLLGLILFVALNRYFPTDWRFIPYRPPALLPLLIGLLLISGLFTAVRPWLARQNPTQLTTAVILLIVTLFVLLKTPALATAVAANWRALSGQQIALAAPTDLTWLGFSYVAFRLIHTLRDRQTGQLSPQMAADLDLRTFAIYVLFTPAYIAGPIDRIERFAADLQAEAAQPPLWGHGRSADLYASRYWQAGSRLVSGLAKKFIIADSLAFGMSLTAVNAEQASSTFWLWMLLYGYALRLFFDFSGYSDIAIGLAILFGIQLPENFNRPYLASNLTSFWQRWHITLSDWARFYIFTPLSRTLLRRQPRPSTPLILLTAHLSTMIVIGLWHGISLNFFIWGLWHGLGLFAHKMWSDRTRAWQRKLANNRWQKQLWTAVAWLLTFHYVVLGWVWFALPTPALALQTLAKLFGATG